MPLGTRYLSDIAVRKIDSIEDGTLYFEGGNYADETTIVSKTSYEVDPGKYYVFLRYHNTETGVSGFWRTNSDNYINVAKGEEWLVEYDYYGGRIKKIK